MSNLSATLQKDAKNEASISAFVKRQVFARGEIDPALKLTNQVAIITGANVGLGFETARQLCQRGLGQLIVAVRSQSKGDEAAAKLRAEFPDTKIDVSIVDMQSYASVQAFVKRCEDLPRLDLVLLNAGIQMSSRTIDEATGHEVDLQVNYLSTALLTILLLPVLRSKRITGGLTPILSIVASDTAFWADVTSFEGSILKAMDEADFGSMSQYSRSKLLIIMFTAVLASKVSHDDVILNTVNPGLTGGTSLSNRTIGAAGKLLMSVLIWPLARSVGSGANAVVHGMLVEGQETQGSFLSDWTVKPYVHLYPDNALLSSPYCRIHN